MTTATRTATPMPHIWLDERGRAWIDETNVKVIEVVLDTLGPDRPSSLSTPRVVCQTSIDG